jgi:hypothetical protein
MRALLLITAFAALGCRDRADRGARAPAGRGGSGAQATVGEAAGSAEGSPAGPGTASGAAAPAAGDAAVAIDPAMHAFCVRSMLQIKKCFDDEAFWDAHATTFFAAQKKPIDPEEKKHWIGVYKDSFVSLVRAHELEQNCTVMLEQNQLPTPAQMELVDAAMKQSCAAFGGALGYVLYSEGAFYRPRDGTIPTPLELAPAPSR